MEVTLKLKFLIKIQHYVSDMTISFKRSENVNNSSNIEIIHFLRCTHYPLKHCYIHLFYLFNLFGAKGTEKLILLLEIFSCGYD